MQIFVKTNDGKRFPLHTMPHRLLEDIFGQGLVQKDLSAKDLNGIYIIALGPSHTDLFVKTLTGLILAPSQLQTDLCEDVAPWR